MEARHLSLSVNGHLGIGIKHRSASDMARQAHLHLGTMDLGRVLTLRVLPGDFEYTEFRRPRLNLCGRDAKRLQDLIGDFEGLITGHLVLYPPCRLIAACGVKVSNFPLIE